MTLFTFTSVVWAESITETRSSRSLRKRSAISASECSSGEPLDDRADAIAPPPEAAPCLARRSYAPRAWTRSTRSSPDSAVAEPANRVVEMSAAPGRPSAVGSRRPPPRRRTRVCRSSTSGPSIAQKAPRSALVRHADAPRVDEPGDRREPCGRYCTCVCPQTTTSASTPVERRDDLVVRRDPGEMGSSTERGRRVAEEHVARARRRRAPPSTARPTTTSTLVAEAMRARHQPASSRPPLDDDLALGVPGGRSAHRRARSAVEDLGRQRPRERRRRRPRRLDPSRLDLGEHSLERGQVPVDVADRRDAHGADATASARRGPAQRDRAQGSPSRRTRSESGGSPPLGSARSPPRARPRAQGHRRA